MGKGIEHLLRAVESPDTATRAIRSRTTQPPAARGFDGKEPWDCFCDATGRTVGYDGIGVTRATAVSEGGGPADGRMAYLVRLLEANPRSLKQTSTNTCGCYPL